MGLIFAEETGCERRPPHPLPRRLQAARQPQPALLKRVGPNSWTWHMGTPKIRVRGGRSTPTVTVFNFVPKCDSGRPRQAFGVGPAGLWRGPGGPVAWPLACAPDCDRIRGRGTRLVSVSRRVT